MIAAFRQGLAEAGYVDGQNVTIDYRWAEGQFNRLPALAAELVARRPAILVAGGGDVSAVPAKAATTTVPLLFPIRRDPPPYDLVSNLSRPSGNLTGVTFFTITLGPKRLELLRELLPKASKIAMLVNPKSLNPTPRKCRRRRAPSGSLCTFSTRPARGMSTRRFDRWRKRAPTPSSSSPIPCSPADVSR